MSEEQEAGKAYEVKDKRRVNADGSLREGVEEQPAAEAQAAESAEAEEVGAEQAETAERAEAEQPSAEEAQAAPEMPPPSVYDMLQFVAGLLSEQAWVQMGIRIAPGQKESNRDLAQAKVAIDTVAFIADKLHPHIGEEDRRAIQALVSDLQINFVRQNQ